MTTIYLSSTYEDLKEYREEVYKSLRKSGYNVIAMEDYVATDRRPVDKCLADIAEADIYVGLFAFSYGYVPPPDHGNPDRLSITELEFRHAEKLGKPCLIAFVSEDTPWPPKFVDPGFKNNDIHRLREYLLKEKMVNYFSSPHELASVVQSAVVRVVEYQRKADEERRREQERQRSEEEAKRKAEETFFFSYSRADSEFVLKLAADLRSTGANLWLDQLDIPAGHRWDRAIEQALKACSGLFVVLSPASVASDNVMDEVSFGIENNKTIVPIIYKECDVPFRLKRFQYIDFRVDYDNGLKRLVRTLKPLDQVSTQQPVTPVPESQTRMKPAIVIRDTQEPRGAKLFISYSHKDEDLRSQLDAHIKLMQRTGLIKIWHDRLIKPGDEWKDEIDQNLETADIVLLLVSVDFLNSDFCWSKEMARALRRHDAGDARVIPIIVRDCDWRDGKFAKLQTLPKDGKAVALWPNRDSAWRNVAEGIRKAAQEILA